MRPGAVGRSWPNCSGSAEFAKARSLDFAGGRFQSMFSSPCRLVHNAVWAVPVAAVGAFLGPLLAVGMKVLWAGFSKTFLLLGALQCGQQHGRSHLGSIGRVIYFSAGVFFCATALIMIDISSRTLIASAVGR